MDKINIVSLQAVLEMSSFSMDTCSMSINATGQSIASSKIWLFKTAPDIDEPPFQFIHTMDLSVGDTMLHDSADLVIHKTTAACNSTGWTQESLAYLESWRNSSAVARARRSVLVHSPAEHSRYQRRVFYFFATQDIARIVRKVKDNFLAISHRSLVAMAPCQRLCS